MTDVAAVVVESVESLTARTVRNTGSHTVTVERGSEVESGHGFDIAAAKEQIVWLAPGEALWGVCASAQTTTLEVI